MDAVSPEYAVISCGEDNEYGHPHAATLNTLRSMGVKVFRTDEQGSLIAVSDGKKITWNAAPSDTWKAGEPTGSGAVSSDTGKNAADTGNDKAADKSAGTEQSTAAAEEVKQSAPQDTQGLTYVLNVKTKKFHIPSCSYLPTSNRKDSTQSREEIVSQGYEPCKKCNP